MDHCCDEYVQGSTMLPSSQTCDVSVALLFQNSGSSPVTLETHPKGRRDIEERSCVRKDVSWDAGEA